MMSFDEQRDILEPNRWLLPLAIVSIVLGAALVVASFSAGSYVDTFGPGVCVLGLLGLFFSRTANLKPRQRSARVRADATGIHIDGALRVGRAAIARAFMQPRTGGWPLFCIRGRRWAPNLDVVVYSEQEGARLLALLEVDVSRRAVGFLGPSPVHASRRAVLLAVLGCLASLVCFPILAITLGLPAAVALPVPLLMFGLAFFPSTIFVGADGVLTRWLGFRRAFYSYDEICSVSPFHNGVSLHLASGRVASIVTSPPGEDGDAKLWGGNNRDAVWARIEEARRAYAQHRELDAAALVARGGRSVSAWLQALRALPRAADYRRAAVPIDALWRIAEDPSAEPTARAGAAVALRHVIDPGDRARLRVAAEASVSPGIQLALHAAASADDESEIIEALEGVEAQVADTSVRSA